MKMSETNEDEENEENRSSSKSFFFCFFVVLLSLIIVVTSILSLYLLHQQNQRNRQRQQRKEEFKRKYKIPKKIVEWFRKNSRIINFLSKFSSQHGSALKQLLNDIFQMIFPEDSTTS